MSKQHEIDSLEFDGDWMVLAVDGNLYRFPVKAVSERLAQASEQERQIYQISPSGYGIHWPTLDEDLSVNGLLKLAAAPAQARA